MSPLFHNGMASPKWNKNQMKDNSLEHIFLFLRVLKHEYILAWF